MTVSYAVRRRLMCCLLPATPPPLSVGVAVAAVVVTLETAALALLRAAGLQSQPSAPIYALGVLVLATVWGGLLGVAAALASTVAFALLLAPPGGPHPTVFQDLQRFAVLSLVALVSAGLANLARARSADAGTAAEVARLILGPDELPAGLQAGSRHLAARFGLASASIELGAEPGSGVIVLGDVGRLVVPDTTPPATVDRLRESLGPALTGILRSAVDRQRLIGSLRDSQQATQALLAEQAALRRVA
ncbi:DUF4118 domain-containing protein, partial [Dactylosporangium sp. NPDC005572]|uniref:DUF4118 domain-containing protein n=1 Tax=Dactylosporangium sp. NPDC005572 TaxID=3156889 RepID=UPI00339E5B88